MLQQLLSEMLPTFVVTNEPARIECGAPDFIISSSKTNTPVFYVEAKDIDDRDLDGRKENKEQFTRYKKSLDYIIFTDYLDFHLYENGEWVKNVRLAEVQGDNIVLCKEDLEDFIALVNHIASTKPSKITSAKRLAIQMAAKARILASTINNAFCLAEEDCKSAEKNKQLQGQLDAFRKVLLTTLRLRALPISMPRQLHTECLRLDCMIILRITSHVKKQLILYQRPIRFSVISSSK